MTLRKIPLTFLILTLSLGASCAYAKKPPHYYEEARPLTAAQAALINKAIAQEKVIIRNIQQHTPLVETYLQETRPNALLNHIPVGDYYMLSRVDFGKAFFDKPYKARDQAKHGFFSGSHAAMSRLSALLGLEKYTYNPSGFMDMMFVDPKGFNTQNYQFSFVRYQFLGSVRTAVFNVFPLVRGMGRFIGQIWVEDPGGNIVRFNGTYTGPRSRDGSKYFFHFDSWRMEIQPGLWLPAAVYVQEAHRTASKKSSGLMAQTHFWGYSLKLPQQSSQNVSMQVENAVDQSGKGQNVGPLQASRMWVQQAAQNVIDRLVQAGLVAPARAGGYEHKILDQIAINLIVPNNLAFPEQVRCRVLLTDTIEATTVGDTILLSRGLINTLPNEPAFASVIAMELAHIALGQHVNTSYAFSDRLLFPDESTFQRINLGHTPAENEAAAKLAMKYLENSMYKNELPEAGLYYEQLMDWSSALKAMNTPEVGDSLLNAQGVPWMDALEKMAPKIDWTNLNQTAALPLGSWIKIDPWNDTVHQLHAARYAPLNASEKMPFEVTPIYYNLQHYTVAQNQTPATPGGQHAAQSAPNAASAQQPAGTATNP
jgi:hypothetical protein